MTPDLLIVDNQCVVLTVDGLGAGAQALTVAGVKSFDQAQTIAKSIFGFTASGYGWTETGTVAKAQDLYGSWTPGGIPGTVIAVGDAGFDIFSSGRTQWSNYDEVTFAFKEIHGDFDLAARVEFQDSSSRWARAGLMVREALNVGEDASVQATTASRYVSIHANPLSCFDNGAPQFLEDGANKMFESHFRAVVGDGTTSMAVCCPEYPNAWVRLVRQGDSVSSFVGNNGQDWTQVAAWVSPSLAETVYVGPSFSPESFNIYPYEGSRERLYLAKLRFAATDSEPPSITDVTVTPQTLWPANHKLALVTVDYTVADNKGVAATWLSAVSTEPDVTPAAGDLADDIQLIPGDPHHLYLRAERADKGKGRTYKITIHALDGNNNASAKEVKVTIPLKGGRK